MKMTLFIQKERERERERERDEKKRDTLFVGASYMLLS
jgi:hypothetical protein